MKSLSELQTSFKASLLDGTNGFEDAVQSPPERLAIYQNAYQIRLMEALCEDYPITRKLLSDDFEWMAQQYMTQHPSTHFSIRWFGQHFGAYLSKLGMPQASEMAAFEWALHLSLDAKDAKLLTKQHLSTLSAEQWAKLQLVFHPSVQRLTFEWAIPPLWKALSEDNSLPLAVSHQTYLIWRCHLNSKYESLSTFQIKLSELIEKKISFGVACEAMCEHYPPAKVPTLMVQHLQHWIEQEVLIISDT